MSRRCHLSDEERAVWTGFARSITPLKRHKSAAGPMPAAPEGPMPPQPRLPHEPPPAAKSLPLAPFDRRVKQRLARGRDAIDARIDLHGMTQPRAHAALLRFLRRAQADGARFALVVTGKGAGASTRDGSGEPGVLRRQVPLWLALPEFRPLVVGFEEAHGAHGGQGALYVRLRRAHKRGPVNLND